MCEWEGWTRIDGFGREEEWEQALRAGEAAAAAAAAAVLLPLTKTTLCASPPHACSYNLATVERLYHAWGSLMPRVHPCYAVKCNPDEGLLATLAALGAGFDCASEAEMAAVLTLGVDPSRIIYAHPCKPPKQIRWAAANNVGLTTFDTESELHKVGGCDGRRGEAQCDAWLNVPPPALL